MNVIATKKGFYGKIREAGDEFEVPAGIKGSWFAPVKSDEKPVRSKKGAAKAEQDEAEQQDGDAEQDGTGALA